MAGLPVANYSAENAPAYEGSTINANLNPSLNPNTNLNALHHVVDSSADHHPELDVDHNYWENLNFPDQQLPFLDDVLNDYGGLDHHFPQPAAVSNHEAGGTSGAFCTTMQGSMPNCVLRPHIYEPSPSLTFFISPPPPSTVVPMECLPPPVSKAERVVNISPPTFSINPLQHNTLLQNQLVNTVKSAYDARGRSCTESFHSCPSLLGDSSWQAGFHTVEPICEASAWYNMLPASAMDISINQDADAANFVDQVPQLMEGHERSRDNQILMQPLEVPCLNDALRPSSCPERGRTPFLMYTQGTASCCNMRGAGFATETVEFTSAATSTVPSSSDHASTLLYPHHGMSVSAPVSPTEPLFLYTEAPDMGSVHGGSVFSHNMEEKTEYYKVVDKLAWRKPGAIISKKKRPRGTGHCVIPSVNPSVSEEMNATRQSVGRRGNVNSMLYEDSKVRFKVKTHILNLNDGYVWKKYGEKTIRKEKFTRTYLRCAECERSGCEVLKRTQRCSDDEDYVCFLYLGRHNHHPIA